MKALTLFFSMKFNAFYVIYFSLTWTLLAIFCQFYTFERQIDKMTKKWQPPASHSGSAIGLSNLNSCQLLTCIFYDGIFCSP